MANDLGNPLGGAGWFNLINIVQHYSQPLFRFKLKLIMEFLSQKIVKTQQQKIFLVTQDLMQKQDLMQNPIESYKLNTK